MLQAVGKNIILKAVSLKRKSGIITLTEDKADHYEVISVGNKVEGINEGDCVLLAKFGILCEVADGDDKFVLSNEDAIYAKKIS